VPTNNSEKLEQKDSIGLKMEEAGLRSGGRGKSEIASALRMCSNELYIKALYKATLFMLIFVGKLLSSAHRISQKPRNNDLKATQEKKSYFFLITSIFRQKMRVSLKKYVFPQLTSPREKKVESRVICEWSARG
jgi:hypothetical protein